MGISCIELTVFDYSEYVSACMSLSIFWYIWKPKGQHEFRIDRYVPLSQSKRNQKQLSAIIAWAERTDPGSVIRFANMKREWHDTHGFELLYKSSQSSVLFLEPSCKM